MLSPNLRIRFAPGCIQDKCPYTPDGNLGFDGRNCYIRPAGWTTDLLMPCYYDTDLRQASSLAKHSLCGPYRLKLVTCPKLSVPHWVARGCNWYLNMTPMRIGVPVNDANQDDYPCSAWIMVLSINAGNSLRLHRQLHHRDRLSPYAAGKRLLRRRMPFNLHRHWPSVGDVRRDDERNFRRAKP